jgi:hypothetical protein
MSIAPRRSPILVTLLFLTISTMLFTTAQAQTYNVEGWVWLDSNCNGLQDTGEDGFPSVKVALMHQGTDATVYTRDDRLLEYNTSAGITTSEENKGSIRFTYGLPSLPENYFLAIFNADKPAGYVPGPLQAGSDRTIDNDLYLPMAADGSPLWATVPFQLDPNGPVTHIDIGLCAENTQQPITYDTFLYVPLVLR